MPFELSKLPALKKLPTGNAQADKFQEYVAQQFGLLSAPFLQGRYLTTTTNGQETNLIPLTTTATDFPHLLGKEPEGFLITYQDANAVIWWDRSGTEDRTLFLRLDASGTVNAKVWVW
jgi:hypothetical protein